MNNNKKIIRVLNEIMNISSVSNISDMSQNEACYKLGLIHGRCMSSVQFLEYLDSLNETNNEPCTDEKKVIETIKNCFPTEKKERPLHAAPRTSVPIPKAYEITSKVIKPKETFQDYCKKEIEKRKADESDEILNLLERNGSHMNIKFEIDKRWANKNYAKTVHNLLVNNGIVTMNDFLTKFDDPELFKYLASPKMNVDDKTNKKFGFRAFSEFDRTKMCQLYLAANDFGKENYNQRLRDCIGIKNQQHKESMCVNAMYRHMNIATTNQLYFYLNKCKSMSEFRKNKGMCHVSEGVERMFNYIHK